MTRADILLRRIEEIVAAMDPMTRAVFLAHRVQGWDYPKIAHTLGIGIPEVERHVAAAIVALDCGLRATGD